MANNVLDKSAMATLARLENELPHIGESLAKLADGQEAIHRDQKEITRSISSLCRDVAVVTARAQRNADDIKVHDKQIGTMKDDVAGLKVTNKAVGGANAIYTTIAGILLAMFGGN